MDYHLLAEELIELHRRLLSFPVNRMLADLAKGELFVLNYLMVHQDPVHPKELSQQMMVSTARVAALLNRMEEEGLIVRLPDSRDNRQTIITPTVRNPVCPGTPHRTGGCHGKSLRTFGSGGRAELPAHPEKDSAKSDAPCIARAYFTHVHPWVFTFPLPAILFFKTKGRPDYTT